MSAPKYPEVEVELSGSDGNAFMIVDKVRRAMRDHGVPSAEITAFSDEATSGDYDNVLRTAIAWVDVS